jgi:hypothetical protein
VLFSTPAAPAWVNYADTYQAGEVAFDPSLIPPVGYWQPERNLGKVWRGDPRLRDRLGWAVAPATAYTVFWQVDGVTAELYISGPNGEIFRLSPDQSRWGREK